MMLSFKSYFKAKILNGMKVHTIREDQTNRWKEGNKIHFCINARTKNVQIFKKGICTGKQKITIKIQRDGYLSVKVDKFVLSCIEVDRLAINDGFADTSDMIQWFFKDIHPPYYVGRKLKYCFCGKIIHWKNFNY